MMPHDAKRSWAWPGVAAGVLALGAGAWMLLHRAQPAAAPVVAAAGADTGAVSAAGLFEPMEPVTHVGAPYIDGHPGRVAALKVAEGEPVRAGEVIAEMAGRAQLEAAVRQAEARVAVDEAELQQTEASPKTADVSAQRAEIARAQALLENAQAEYKRDEGLRVQHDVSAEELDAKRTEMLTAQQTLAAARAKLAGMTEQHAQVVQEGTAELELARAELQRAQVDLADAVVRAPIDGVVLHVDARPGEEVGPQGVVELARTAEMDVLAEVYETDITRVKVGQRAEVRSELLPAGAKLMGTVVQIGSEVGRSAIVTGDQAAFADARVVKVRIRLDDAKTAARLIHGKVSVIVHA